MMWKVHTVIVEVGLKATLITIVSPFEIPPYQQKHKKAVQLIARRLSLCASSIESICAYFHISAKRVGKKSILQALGPLKPYNAQALAHT